MKERSCLKEKRQIKNKGGIHYSTSLVCWKWNCKEAREKCCNESMREWNQFHCHRQHRPCTRHKHWPQEQTAALDGKKCQDKVQYLQSIYKAISENETSQRRGWHWILSNDIWMHCVQGSRWPKKEWALHLVTLLEHEVSAAYMVMDFVEALFIKNQQRGLNSTPK